MLDGVDAARDNEQPVFKAFFDPSRLFSWAFLRDVGEAAAKVLKEGETHFYATYPLCSTVAMSYSELASRVGTILGLDQTAGGPFKIEVVDFRVAIDTLNIVNFGRKDVDQIYTDPAERMLLYYHTRGLPGNPNVLQWLLGRKPARIEDVIKELRGGSPIHVMNGE